MCEPMMLSHSGSIDSISTLSPQDSRRSRFLPLGFNERGYTTLVNIVFQSTKSVCNSVSPPSLEHLRLRITTLGQFGRQADTNTALIVTESLLWGVSDSIQTKRKNT